MEKIFETPKTLLIQKKEEQTESITKIVRESFTEGRESVTALFSFGLSSGFTKSITLWEGAEIGQIGQYTDEDIMNRALEVLGLK